MQLCLGTVQFGMDYGIRNQKKPDLEDAVTYLDYATQNGVCAIDTAAAYGSAEQVVGEFLRRKTIARDRLFISTKLLPNILDDVCPDDYVSVIRENLQTSLETLGLDMVDAYLLHSAGYAHRPEILDALAEMKKEGLAGKVGVSVYEPEEATDCMEHDGMEFIQAPYSIFDHRMKKSGVLKRAAASQCGLAVRSAFIQGLVAMQRPEVPPFLEEAVPVLERLDRLSSETGLSRIELAVGYVRREPEISYLVFGIDSLEQLKEDIAASEKDMPDEIYREIEAGFEGIRAEIVMPSLWKR